MRSLLNEYEDIRWGPIPIEKIRDSFVFDKEYPIKSNIAYNFQYLEYIDKQLSDLKLTSVITNMLYKTYVITAMSIIEAIFYLVLKTNNLLDKDCWINVNKYVSNSTSKEGVTTRVISQMQEKVDEYEKRINFDYLISKIEKKNLLRLNSFRFSMLDYLRELRNKVHIYILKNSKDTDYNSFNRLDYLSTKAILHSVLLQENVTKISHRDYIDKYFENILRDWYEENDKTKIISDEKE